MYHVAQIDGRWTLIDPMGEEVLGIEPATRGNCQRVMLALMAWESAERAEDCGRALVQVEEMR